MIKLEDRPWWPDLVALKDVLSLREMSARFGAAPAAVSNALKRNGFDRVSSPPGPRERRDPRVKEAAQRALAEAGEMQADTDADGRPQSRGRLAPYRHLIGTKIDREVAELAGVSVSAVTNYRRRHDIPAATRLEAAGPSEPSPDMAPTHTHGILVQGKGFRVTIGGNDFVVVADDIVQAARIACDSQRGRVVRVELLGGAIAA